MKSRRWANSSSLDLINPLEPNLNVSYNVNKRALELFQETCRQSIKKLDLLNKRRSDEARVKDGLFWLLESDFKVPTRPKVELPNLFEMDLGGNSSKNKVKEDVKAEEKIELTQVNLGGNTRSISNNNPKERSKINSRLLSNKHLKSLLTEDLDETNNKSNGVTSSTENLEEVQRLEKLKTKYLRHGGSRSKFSHKL